MAKNVQFDLQTAKKYVFWACVPVGLIITIACFYLSVTTVASTIDSRKKALDGMRTRVKNIQNAAPHPNAETIEEITSETGMLNKGVVSAWEVLAKDQKNRNDWTKLGLNARALADVTKRNFLEPLEPSTLDNYRLAVKDKVTKELPALIKPCQPLQPLLGTQTSGATQSTPTRAARTARSSRSNRTDSRTVNTSTGMTEEEKYADIISTDGIVAWYPPELVFTIVDWDAKLVRSEEWKVWLTQEEVWVYDTLFNIIKQSNDKVKAGSPRTAVVKGIGSILIGKEASAKLAIYSQPRMLGIAPSLTEGLDSSGDGTGSNTMPPGAMGAGLGDSPGASGMAEDSGYNDDEGYEDGAGFGGNPGVMSPGDTTRPVRTERQRALQKRYVDSNGKPTSYNASAPYRRMPIFLSLVVSQAKIPEILAECANSAMPIDVLWVRVNPTDDQESFSFDASAYASSSGNSSAGSGMPSAGLRSPSAGSRSSRTTRGQDSGTNTHLGADNLSGQVDVNQFGADAVPIEIYGCINIFSTPRSDLQGVGTGSAADGETVNE